MGASGSCLPRYGWCVPRDHPNVCKENHTSTPHKKKSGHRRNLSAAFNLADLEKDCTMDLLNVNTATEEELMTLPGINRQTAHNIIEYRRQIGAFKKVEDIALVSGVGATKLTHLRLEICVRKGPKSSSVDSTSSTTSSRQDLSLYQDNISRSSSKSQRFGQLQVVSVNSSNVFQLMKVKGISQNLAENIVMYRERKGPFRSVDDLLKVKGIKPYLLSAVRQHLTTEDMGNGGDGRSTSDYYSTSGFPTSVSRDNPSSVVGTGGNNNNLDSASTNAMLNHSSSQEDMISLYGPLASKSYRGKRKKMYFMKRDNRQVMRIATWNLQQCDEQKTMNPGVKEVFAMTALENGLGIIAVQELGDSEALQKLCDELNHPTIPNVKKFSGHHGVWKCVTSPPAGRMYQGSERLGFLYDASRGVELMSHALLEKSQSSQQPFTRRPFIAVFQVNKFDVVLVNMHLKATGLRDEDLERTQAEVDRLDDLLQALDEHLDGEKDVVLMGDFNLEPSADEFTVLRERGYHNAIPTDKYTNISMRNPEGSRCYDNVWIGPHTNRVYTGTSDVVREGLTSPWIPDGWGWGGLATDHCPTWAEFFTDADFEHPDAIVNHHKSDTSLKVKDIQVALRVGMSGAEL